MNKYKTMVAISLAAIVFFVSQHMTKKFSLLVVWRKFALRLYWSYGVGEE